MSLKVQIKAFILRNWQNAGEFAKLWRNFEGRETFYVAGRKAKLHAQLMENAYLLDI